MQTAFVNFIDLGANTLHWQHYVMQVSSLNKIKIYIFFFIDTRSLSQSTSIFVFPDSEPCQSESPIDIISSPDSPGSSSPCESPISLFPPLHLDNLFTPPPSLPPTSPTVDSPAEPISPSVEPTDYFSPSHHTPAPSDADFARVHFIDLKDLYEKTQVRRRGVSEQRLVDCHVHMFSHFTSTLYNIEVYVCRYPKTGDLEDKTQLPVALQKTLPNTVCIHCKTRNNRDSPY